MAKAGKKADKGEPKDKKPLVNYMLFCKVNREAIKKKNPDADFSAIGKLLGVAWSKVSDKDKAIWKTGQQPA